MPTLLDYLNSLDQDAAAREAHNQDPVGAMTNFGLTAEEQAAFLSGDTAKMASVAGVESIDADKIQVVHTSPDPESN